MMRQLHTPVVGGFDRMPRRLILTMPKKLPSRMRVYTGVCDTRANWRTCNFLEKIGRALGGLRFVLRSGGSGRGELALERGANRALAPHEIYLPWAGFNRHASSLHRIPEDAFRLCSDLEPRWQYLGRGVRKLMARACLELFGRNLDRPSLFLIGWTPFGMGEGECGTALLLARLRGIPILDLGHYDALPEKEMLAGTLDFLRQFGIESNYPRPTGQLKLAM